MKFLNYDKVLVLSPHPDDAEYGMLGAMMKFKDTMFDIVVLSDGGDFDESTKGSRREECKKVWEHIDNINGSFMEDTKFIRERNEDEWVHLLETKYDISTYDCIMSPPSNDSHFEHQIVSNLPNALGRREQCGIIHYKTVSILDTWIPNFFVDLGVIENRDTEDGHSNGTHTLFMACIRYAKTNKLTHFESQQKKQYFQEDSIKSFHSHFGCSKRGIDFVEEFHIVRGYN